MSEKNSYENVIKFPLTKRPTPHDDPEAFAEAKRVFALNQIQYAVDEATSHLIHDLINAGYPITQEKSNKSIILIMEAMTSMLYELHGFDHPFQQHVLSPPPLDDMQDFLMDDGMVIPIPPANDNSANVSVLSTDTEDNPKE